MEQLLTCAQCGQEFARRARGPAARYCSGTCKARACDERARADGRFAQWRETQRQRIEATKVRKPCPHCGEPLAHSRRVQCGRPACERAYNRARAREDSRKRRAKRAKSAAFSCDHCGKHCIPGDNVAPHAKRFCGQSCKRRWHADHPSPDVVAKRRRATRRAQARRKLQVAADGSTGGRRIWRSGPCAECGNTFVSQYQDAICCTLKCTNRSTRRRNRRKYRERHGSDSHRARARRYGVPYEPVKRESVFAADEWRCGICGEPTDRDAAPCSPRAPSLDHVVPLSKGGPHTRDNLQCAHFECNSLKSDALEVPVAA